MTPKKLIIITMVSLMVLPAMAQQDTLNQLDKNGMKHGYWRKVDKDTLKYEGHFEHGNPAGLFIYYYADKKMKSTVSYCDNGKTAQTIMYHPNGAMMAIGKYVEQKKDSVWKYFNEQGILVSEENYMHGKGHGAWLKYSPEGHVIEKVEHKDGNKEGGWLQYFDNGKVKLQATYRNNLLEGAFLMYYSNGLFCLSGKYEKSLPAGVWVFYNIKGEIERKDTYSGGRKIKTEQILPVVEPDSEEARKEVEAFRRQLISWGIE